MAFVFGRADATSDAPTTPGKTPVKARGRYHADGDSGRNDAAKTSKKLPEGIEGVISFKSQGFAGYRYQITAKNEKLRIWLEDIKSKKQWSTSMLKLEDFMREDSVIPMATFNDYAVCFANCLQNTTSSDFACDLSPAPENPEAWILTLTLKLRVFVSEWTPTYRMLLNPITLERTDILEAKIRDQEDQIRRLEDKVDLLVAKIEMPVVVSPVFATGHNKQAAGMNQPIVWIQDSLFGNVAIVFKPAGTVAFTVSGTFMINLVIHNGNTSNNTPMIELQVNGKPKLSIRDSNGHGYVQSTAVCHVLTTKAGDELQVVYKGNSQVFEDSQIVIHQLR